jgi:flagellar biosynthetic protein FliS
VISHPALSYHQASARGASPVGQVVSLYDTILRDFVRALAALQARDVETRVLELNHALLVIAHLQSVLNHERGGEAAKQFDQLYAVTRGMIVEANIRATPESLEELINLYGVCGRPGIRQTSSWRRTNNRRTYQPRPTTRRQRMPPTPQIMTSKHHSSTGPHNAARPPRSLSLRQS